MSGNLAATATLGLGADIDMGVYFVVGDGPEAVVFHDQPFSKPLSWIEYDIETSRLDFILEDGDIRNFGIPIDRKFNVYMQNLHTISVVRQDAGECVEGYKFPLIVHRA